MVKFEEEEDPSNSNGGPNLSSSYYEDTNSDVDTTASSQNQIGVRENKAVTRGKCILTLLMLFVSSSLCSTIYINRKLKQKSDFQQHFQGHASKLRENLLSRTARSVRALEGFAVQITIHAKDHEQVWPQVVVSNFEARAQITMDIAPAISALVFAPMVTNDTDKKYWEKFSIKHQEWLPESLAVQQNIEQNDTLFYHGEDLQIPSSIFKVTGIGTTKDHGPGPYAPLWQFAPAVPVSTIVNMNTFSVPSRAAKMNALLRTGESQIGEALDYYQLTEEDLLATGDVFPHFLHYKNENDNNNDNDENDNNNNSTTPPPKQTTTIPMHYRGGPVSDFYSPIYNHVGGTDREMTGILTSYIYWQVYLQNALQDNVHGLIAVLENTCGQRFTYELNGKHVRYLGVGDLHELQYDSLLVTTNPDPLFASATTTITSTTTKKEEKEEDLISNDDDDEDDNTSRSCIFSIRLYPSSKMESVFITNKPIMYTAALIFTFLFTSIVFLWHQCLVDKRQKVVMKAAVQSTAVVNTLFPANVRDRLFEDVNNHNIQLQQHHQNHEQQQQHHQNNNNNNSQQGMDSIVNSHKNIFNPNNNGDNNSQEDGVRSGEETTKHKKTFQTSETIFGCKPIADLFPNTTVMFADMVGFTAWASVREPTQVFTLLETIYHSFDMIAKRMRVFKVETVGDCYVAVTGLPNPRKDHALAMAKFATSCLSKMDELCRELETSLGPDTADLGLRIGLHSGPVTAGVLRGDKGRFQLFGDTMNTASRMESTGSYGKIHISRETADLLRKAGKEKWLTVREEKIVAKGKGELETFWLRIRTESSFSSHGSATRSSSEEDSTTTGGGREPVTSSSTQEATAATMAGEKPVVAKKLWKVAMDGAAATAVSRAADAKTGRLIQWNVDVLAGLLKKILSRRRGSKDSNTGVTWTETQQQIKMNPGQTVLDEVVDIIALPKFSADSYAQQKNSDDIRLPDAAMKQLTQFVTDVAAMYGQNPFHNYEHASHVTMSVTKLLSRIVNPGERKLKGDAGQKTAAELHDHTFGITSDPLTHFACVFAALIHDVDHPGVTNAVLVKEQRPEAIKYKNKSVAEQKSVDLAWDLLMNPKNKDLHSCIFETMDELKRFRQLVVNVVMATDIMDTDLGALRKARWEKAFRQGACDTVAEDVNRKATIVIEHLIQASDVAHTMQHWHVYRKWNERLFHEMYRAYKAGRLEKDPSEFWYRGEMGFFDFYILPLAKKLETCGVFGVSSDEYLNYALANRREWEERGELIVKEYTESYKG